MLAALVSAVHADTSLQRSKVYCMHLLACPHATVKVAFPSVTYRRRETQPQQSHMQRAMPKWQICSCPKQADPTQAGT